MWSVQPFFHWLLAKTCAWSHIRSERARLQLNFADPSAKLDFQLGAPSAALTSQLNVLFSQESPPDTTYAEKFVCPFSKHQFGCCTIFFDKKLPFPFIFYRKRVFFDPFLHIEVTKIMINFDHFYHSKYLPDILFHKKTAIFVKKQP